MKRIIFIANEDAGSNELLCSNTFAVAANEIVVPYGDYPHSKGLQRLTRQTAETLCANFRSWAEKLGRAFGGAPIYIGHPDDSPANYPDTKAYGWVNEVSADPDGLRMKVRWSDAGSELLKNAFYKWFSPYWGCKQTGTANGKPVVEPVTLRSVGLTNNPNIMGLVPLANAKGETAMTREELIKTLGLAPDATDEQIAAAQKAAKDKEEEGKKAAALENEKAALANEKAKADQAMLVLTNEKAALTTEVATLKTEKAALETSLANERKARIGAVLDLAVKDGRVTVAQRPQWEKDLEGSFDTKLTELANAKPQIPMVSQTQDLGKRRGPENDRVQQVQMLVNERMVKSGEDYLTAFAAVQQENTALFAAMKQPKGK